MFGTEFSLQLQETIGHDYSAYYDSARANDLIKQAFIKAIEIKYLDLTSEKNTDELFTLIKTEVPFTPVNNQVNLVTSITDYLHTLAVKTKFLLPLSGVVKAATNANPLVLTLSQLNNLRDSDLISVTGVLGNTAANGENFVKPLYNDFDSMNFTLQLYSDETLNIGVAGNGTYTSGGTVSRVLYQEAKKKESYRKYSTFGEPTVNDPYYEIAQGVMKLLPLNKVCSEISIDYIKIPQVYPDVTDNTFDLETIYPLRFLYFLMDQTAKLMANQSRDVELGNNEQQQMMQP